MNLGIIIQARTSSTRLPDKVLLDFNNENSILDILIKNLKKTRLPIVLATTNLINDDKIILKAERHDCNYFRGSEQDVLERFIESATENNFDYIIRVCSDNPFLIIDDLNKLIDTFKKEPVDYLSYKLKNNVPVIKSHYGFWAEIVSLRSLLKIKQETSSSHYFEHVTNFIYENPDLFRINLLDIPEILHDRNDIRLTIDDEIDFQLSKRIYHTLAEKNIVMNISNLIAFLDDNPEILNLMESQIKKYNK